MTGSVPLDDDPWTRRWSRRALTLPAVHLGAALAWGLLPLWLALALALDLLRGRPRLPLSRAVLFGAVYLFAEVAGVQAALWTWLASGLGARAAWLRRADLRLQRAWTRLLWGSLARIFDLRLQVEAPAALPAPFLLFLRHASLPDVLLPAVAFANPMGIALRYVLKVEVCASPCLDVVGHRLPNAFVRRGGQDPAREVARVLRLHGGAGGAAVGGEETALRPGEGLVIYPEGTRASPGKRAALLARLEGPARARAASFRHVLPPRPGGPLALLAARRPDEDVVFCAHVGTESVLRATALADGSLIGRTFQVVAWRVPAAQVPTEPEQARAWLDQWWHRVDDWVGAHGSGPAELTAARSDPPG